MSTRTRTPYSQDDARLHEEPFGARFDLDEDITDEDIEDFIARHEQTEEKGGFVNLPTLAGLATIGVGAAYLLEQFGLFTTQFEIGSLLGPWLIGVLLILVGFGVLSWKPRRRPKTAARRRAAERRTAQRTARATSPRTERPREAPEVSTTSRTFSGRKQFAKSVTNRKIAGVCGGIGEYFGIDPTIVRIAFVVALIAGQGMAIPLYLILALVMQKPDTKPKRSAPAGEPLDDDRVIVIRG